MNVFNLIVTWCIFCATITVTNTTGFRCDVRMRIESGMVCGLIREAEMGVQYASFRGIPYAKQPLGKLRFQELQPIEPWHHALDATEEGPVCPQFDMIYGDLVKPVRGMSESCIYVNVHVPLQAFPKTEFDEREWTNSSDSRHREKENDGCPIFVFIHGGGFYAGSSNADLNGPEYLVSKGVIVITFNYRIGVFGFLSLNTPSIPGNAGLRDMLTLLRWVQRNARAFGGNPTDVTIGGQSAGSTSAHLLALSKSTRGLFKRVILMSGTAIPTFYSASPVYANIAAATFFNSLGINSTDPEVIHHQLIITPLEDIINAMTDTQYKLGLVSFVPVVEAEYPGVTRIVDDDPIDLIQKGRDKEYPMIIGVTNEECQSFRYILQNLKMLRRIRENPVLVLAGGLQTSTPPSISLALAKKVIDKYFHGKLNYDDYLRSCTDTLFHHPAFQLVRWREGVKAAPSFLYQFSYEMDFSAVKYALYLDYESSAHIDDLTFIFRENALLGTHKSFPPTNRDDHIKDMMTNFVVHFMRCNNPSCGVGWLPVDSHFLNYQLIKEPGEYINTQPTPYERDMIHFLDKIFYVARNASIIGAIPA